MTQALKDLKGLYPKLVIDPAGDSGTIYLIENELKLMIDEDKKPGEWNALDMKTGNVFPASEVTGAGKLVLNKIKCDYAEFAENSKDPIENLKEGGFEIASKPEEVVKVESFEEPEQPKKTEWKVGGAKALTKRQPVSRMPVPENVRSKQIAALTKDDIKSYLCPTATDQEAYMFLQLCQARNLNPFLNEAYLIKFGGKATMVVGKEAYMRRAESHPEFDGFEAGIIIKNESGELERREGTFIMKGEILVGGWAKIYRKDRSKPYVSEVSLDEYNSKQSLWVSKPATMIRKVAIVQGKREAFPSEFSGMYDASEMGGEVIDAVYEVEA